MISFIQGLSCRLCFLKRLSDRQKHLIHVLEVAHDYHRTLTFLNHAPLFVFLAIWFQCSFLNFEACCASYANYGKGARDILNPHCLWRPPVPRLHQSAAAETIDHIICTSIEFLTINCCSEGTGAGCKPAGVVLSDGWGLCRRVSIEPCTNWNDRMGPMAWCIVLL